MSLEPPRRRKLQKPLPFCDDTNLIFFNFLLKHDTDWWYSRCLLGIESVTVWRVQVNVPWKNSRIPATRSYKCLHLWRVFQVTLPPNRWQVRGRSPSCQGPSCWDCWRSLQSGTELVISHWWCVPSFERRPAPPSPSASPPSFKVHDVCTLVLRRNILHPAVLAADLLQGVVSTFQGSSHL